jgi:hypothetical protein
MASYTAIEHFVEWLATKKHDLANDNLRIALIAAGAEPDAANDESYDDLTVIDQENLDSDGPLNVTSVTQTDGTVEVALEDFTILADGGALPAFQFICVYNSSPVADTDKGLISYYDYGSALTLGDGESLEMQFADGKLLTIGTCP